MSLSSITSTSTVAAQSANRDEFLQKMFARLDADGDGKVTQEEFATAMTKRQGASGQADPNRPDPAAIFQKADTNADGSITLDEFKTAMAQMRPAGGHHGQRAGGPPPGPPPAGANDGDGDDDSGKVFDKLDTNHDGVVSMAELLAAVQAPGADDASGSTSAGGTADFEKLFKAVDADGDGSITQGELSGFLKAARQLLAGQDSAGTYSGSGSVSGSDITGGNLDTNA